MYYDIFAIIAPVLLCALVGFCWGKRQPDFDHRLISKLVFLIGVPCLIISKLGSVEIDIASLLEVTIATMLVLFLTGIAALSLCRLLQLETKNYALPLIFPNSGNMGLPLAYFAFGEQGLAIGLIVFAIIMVVHISLGITFISNHPFSLRSLNSPIIYATGLAVLMIITGWKLPSWAGNTVNLLGQVPIPLMLITLGVSLAQLKATALPLSTFLSAVRLVIGFCSGWLATYFLGITGQTQGVIILLATMPVAVFNYLLAVQYGKAPEQVAANVVISTLLSFLTLPWLIGYVIRL